MAAKTCRTCGQPLTACGCPPPLPDTTGRVVKLKRAKIAALQWWCLQVVEAQDPASRAAIWTRMQQLLDADEAALAPWLKRQRRPKMDQATFLRLDAQLRQQRRDDGYDKTDDADIAALMGLKLRTYWRYKRPRA
jgi:hypothetical protein